MKCLFLILNRLFVPLVHLSAHVVAHRKKLIDSNKSVLTGVTDPFYFSHNNVFILNIVESRAVSSVLKQMFGVRVAELTAYLQFC